MERQSMGRDQKATWLMKVKIYYALTLFIVAEDEAQVEDGSGDGMF